MASDLVISDEKSDLTLKVRHAGYTWRFPAHSLLLTAKSEKFREMIEDRKIEDQEESPLNVTIVGTHPDTILTLLKYIYSGEHPTEVTPDLLVAAEKYGLQSLRDHLEDDLLPNLSVTEACHLLEEYQPLGDEGLVKAACRQVLERNAFHVFSSDLVFSLGRRSLLCLLTSDDLNVPDESVVFWGVWRWGRRMCSMNGRRMDDETVAGYIEDMLKLLRMCSLRKRDGIPGAAMECFSRCLCKRSAYQVPEDVLEQCMQFQLCGTWEGLTDVLNTDRGNLCFQVSFDRSAILYGVSLEICAPELSEAFIQMFRESDGKEVLRQKIDCFRCSVRKLNRTSQLPDTWLSSDFVFSEPLSLSGKEIYSAYIRLACEEQCCLPTVLLSGRRKRLGKAWASLHGQAVVAVRELYVVPDAQVSGPALPITTARGRWEPSHDHASSRQSLQQKVKNSISSTILHPLSLCLQHQRDKKKRTDLIRPGSLILLSFLPPLPRQPCCRLPGVSPARAQSPLRPLYRGRSRNIRGGGGV
ncbi:hypothetical protein JTE90_001539 [Oedothorax gibbosus]|uniref:BTB domain-containing protein n=1 Tax=Oedothorax gibbosus TaxID=931172 RepID=A0AAV6VLC6_9ARAC|nr:hypothetical protein JTE90_001539 [Oedothorax gibbosus]